MEEEEAEERRRRRREKKAKKKLALEANGDAGGEPVLVPKPARMIPKIDDKTPTSSIIDLQKKLDQISSPTSAVSSDSSSCASIPQAHREYEKALRQLEQECRNHIKVEQQMKLHIECLQEKVDGITKERDAAKRDLDLVRAEGLSELEKVNKIVKTLEEELIAKAEKIKT